MPKARQSSRSNGAAIVTDRRLIRQENRRHDQHPTLPGQRIADAFVASKASWFTITDDLPQYEARIRGQNQPSGAQAQLARSSNDLSNAPALDAAEHPAGQTARVRSFHYRRFGRMQFVGCPSSSSSQCGSG